MKWARRYFQDSADGRPQYLSRWTPYEVRFTADPAKALAFESREEADLRKTCGHVMRTVPHPNPT